MKRIPLGLTVLLLTIGYAGYYLCRSSFSVAKPLLLDAFTDLDKTSLGFMASVGTLLYAIGKMVHGPLADRLGGKTMFLYGMAGAIGFSCLFGFGGPPLFLLAWAGNRFVQSAGWGGMVRIVSQWTPQRRYGVVMAVVSLSYLFGDFASRLLLGYWVRLGVGWEGLFTYSAAGLVLIAIPVAILLRERPEVPVPKEEIAQPVRTSKGSIFARPEFWMVCMLSFCFTLLRETFNEWTPTYLNEFANLSKADAGQASSVFPLLGGISVLIVGYLSDRYAARHSPLQRLKVMPVGLIASGVLLGVLGLVGGLPNVVVVALVGGVALFLIGPYSLLAGATSLDFGGDEKAATAAGWVDGIGYFGGIVSGMGVGSIAQNLGWTAAINVLAVFCMVVAIGLGLALYLQQKKLADVAQ